MEWGGFRIPTFKHTQTHNISTAHLRHLNVNIIIFFVLLWIRKNNKLNGRVLCTYMILYGISRFFIEGLRIDSLMFLGLRVSKVLSLVIVVIFVVLRLLIRERKSVES